MWSQSTNVTDRQTDRQTTCDRNTTLCTKVHRAVIKHFSAEHIKARAVRRLNAEEQFVSIRPTEEFCHKTFLSRAVCAELIGSSLSSWSTTCMSYEMKKRRTETNRPHYTAHPRRLGASTPTAHPCVSSMPRHFVMWLNWLAESCGKVHSNSSLNTKHFYH